MAKPTQTDNPDGGKAMTGDGKATAESGDDEQMDKGKTSTESEVVTIPEDFQHQVHGIVHKATRAHLSHIRDRVSAREQEIDKQDRANSNKQNGLAAPDTMSDADMPVS